MRIFLIGFMGSGKTTVGKKLAQKMGYDFIDMDRFIEQEEGRTIAQIFDDEGEDNFRKIENLTLKKLLLDENIVVATGGGAPCFYNNIELLNTHSITIYLKMNPKAFVSRVYDPKTERPLLKGKNEAELEAYARQTLAKRTPFYSQAKYSVSAIDHSPETIVNKILDLIEK